jgi:hypothetical protein
MRAGHLAWQITESDVEEGRAGVGRGSGCLNEETMRMRLKSVNEIRAVVHEE